VLFPLAVFELRVRADMADRLTAEYQRRVAWLVAVIRADLSRDSAGIAGRLDALKDAIAADNRFRLAALQGAERAYLLDYAGSAMRLTGLSMLQVQDDQGRIISSGHFRNEFDRVEPELPRLLAVAPGGMALVEAAPRKPRCERWHGSTRCASVAVGTPWWAASPWTRASWRGSLPTPTWLSPWPSRPTR